jgi:hypothetical protein
MMELTPRKSTLALVTFESLWEIIVPRRTYLLAHLCVLHIHIRRLIRHTSKLQQSLGKNTLAYYTNMQFRSNI